jgi:TolB-like protein
LLNTALASDVADDLARNDWLHVTARKPAMDIGADATQAGRDLGVRLPCFAKLLTALCCH